MTASWMILMKFLLKSSLDNYILPGTISGTEILWLYVMQWKRNAMALTLATVYLMGAELELKGLKRLFPISGICQNTEAERSPTFSCFGLFKPFSHLK